jgi:hypothetical protein
MSKEEYKRAITRLLEELDENALTLIYQIAIRLI